MSKFGTYSLKGRKYKPNTKPLQVLSYFGVGHAVLLFMVVTVSSNVTNFAPPYLNQE